MAPANPAIEHAAMPVPSDRVTSVPLPAQSRIVDFYPTTDLADAYAVELPCGASNDPETLARFIFSQSPHWAGRLMRVRDALVCAFGLKTARHLRALDADAMNERIGLFRIYRREPGEILLGEDDRHLDFRLSVLCSQESSPASTRRLTVSTVVRCRNRLGRVYIFLIAPFHRLIMRASLRQAARTGWPTA